MRYAHPPTLDDLLRDAEVDAALKQAWHESNPHASGVTRGLPGSLKQEQGGFIYWNRTTGELEIERLPPGSRDGLQGTPAANTAERELVGSFHTHPTLGRKAMRRSRDPRIAPLCGTSRAFPRLSKRTKDE